MSKKCTACGPVPTRHWLEWTSAVLEWGLGPIMRVLESVKKLIGSIISFDEDRFWLRLVPMLTRLRLAKILPDIPDDQTWRAKVCWQEAKQRGIRMEEIRPFGRRVDLFRAQVKNKTIIFEGLPRPGGATAALEWMDNKGAMRQKFAAQNIPLAAGSTCISTHSALDIFRRLGPPLVIKPRSGSRSRHTTIHITDEKGVREGVAIAHQLSPWIVVERELEGAVHRATCIGGKCVAVCRRDVAQVTGDGIHPVRELITISNRDPRRHTEHHHEIPIDNETIPLLAEQKLTLDSVPINDLVVRCGRKVNRGSGGTVAEVTNTTHPENKKLFEKIATLVGDPLIGIDFIIADITQSWRTQKNCGVIELNSLPFIDLHHFPFEGTPHNVAGELWNLILT